MVVIPCEVTWQPFEPRRNLQQPVREFVGLRFGNGRLTGSSWKPLGSAAFAGRYRGRSQSLHAEKLSVTACGGNVVLVTPKQQVLRKPVRRMEHRKKSP